MAEDTKNTDLIALTTGVIKKERTEEEVKALIKEMDTPSLSDGYSKLKPFEKTVAKLVKIARDELVNVRFPKDKEDVDDKGHWYIPLPGGKKRLQARLSNKFVLDTEAAEDVLTEKGLIEDASDHVINATDVDGLKRLVDSMLSVMTDSGAIDSGLIDGFKQQAEQLLQTKKVLNESKISALHNLGKLTDKDIEGMYEDKSSRALYIVNKK